MPGCPAMRILFVFYDVSIYIFSEMYSEFALGMNALKILSHNYTFVIHIRPLPVMNVFISSFIVIIN